MRTGTIGLYLGAGLLLLLVSGCLLAPVPFSEQAWRERVEEQDPHTLYAAHRDQDGFYNPWMREEDRGFAHFLRWRFSRKLEYSPEEQRYLPSLVPNLAARLATVDADRDFLVWIGHATFLMRISGLYVLTDPMLSQRALLPRRLTQPALTLDELGALPEPLLVLISHNHYDHLDDDSIKAVPDHAVIVAPLELRGYLEELHGGRVIELDWWEHINYKESLVTCLPAQHWSRRIGQGRNSVLWASFMIQSPGNVVYYGGDSGYFVGYREFGQRFERIDYALLPITAYHPRWFMHYPHMNVDEALLAFNDLAATHFIPTQWGTFHLGDNPPGLPMLELEQVIRERGLDEERFVRPKLGQIVYLDRR